VLPIIAAACAFLAVLLALVGLRSGRAQSADLAARLQALRPHREQLSDDTAASVVRRAPSSIPALRKLLSGEWGQGIRLSLDNADLDLTVGEYVALRGALIVLPFAGFVLLFGVPVGLAIGLAVAALGALLPVVYLRIRVARRQAAVAGQLIEFLRLTANALRAGFALLQAIETAARDLGPPLSNELQRLLIDTSLGANTDAALRAFAERNGSYEVRAMVTAVLIQRTTGGNLAEVLDNVAATMEERDRILGEVRTYTAQQRMTGNILSVYPLVLGLLFTLIHPSLMSVLWRDSAGIVLLVIGITLQLCGFFTIRRILDIDY
jgi:tight adherence protein B